jgi:hypothetical protein
MDLNMKVIVTHSYVLRFSVFYGTFIGGNIKVVIDATLESVLHNVVDSAFSNKGTVLIIHDADDKTSVFSTFGEPTPYFRDVASALGRVCIPLVWFIMFLTKLNDLLLACPNLG